VHITAALFYSLLRKLLVPLGGFDPAILGFEVRRLIHYTTEAGLVSDRCAGACC
jgi:hypothetical protein